MRETMTYAGVGVDYDGALDPFKRYAQECARLTSGNLRDHGFIEVAMSRGESVYLIERPDFFLAHVDEGLGTKNLVADAVYGEDNSLYYDNIAQDAVAMIVNDMITLGAMPLSVAMHLAVGDSSWFDHRYRYRLLVRGWQVACNLARCAWGPGETPVLKGCIVPGTFVLKGSAMGILEPKERLIRGNIQPDDAIVLIGSSGIHANGLTMAREIARRGDPLLRQLLNMVYESGFPLRALPAGYMTKMDDGRDFGEALLDPTPIYVRLVQECLDAGIPIHYAVNITGHGWRKLMRHREAFVYVVENIPEPQEVFKFIQRRGPVSDGEAYKNFNMGAGFALYLPHEFVDRVIGIASETGYRAMYGGHIERRGTEKGVEIRPKGITFTAASLDLR